MDDQTRIHWDMARVLMAAGWVVTEPPDLLKADSWGPIGPHNSTSRHWAGTTSMAAYAGPRHFGNRKGPYMWRARLFGRGKHHLTSSGEAKDLRDAMAKADAGLKKLLAEARERRMANQSVFYESERSLFLPVEEG